MELSVWGLWLPIVVSGVVVFFVSAAAWMLLPHHKPEWVGLPNEEAVAKVIRDNNVPPGQYMFPYCSHKDDWKIEEFKRKLASGPVGTLCVWARPANMGMNMALSVLFFIIVNGAIAYLATMALDAGDSFMDVFRFVGTAGIVTYASANVLNGIWFNRKMLADVIDGVAYGVVTGLIFAAMWPGATA
jgi:hypothetical protein